MSLSSLLTPLIVAVTIDTDIIALNVHCCCHRYGDSFCSRVLRVYNLCCCSCTFDDVVLNENVVVVVNGSNNKKVLLRERKRHTAPDRVPPSRIPPGQGTPQ